MRAGTTAIHRHLSEHPDVYMSPVKEPNYFARDDGPPWMAGISGEELRRYLEGPMPPRHNALVRSWDDYLRLFRYAGGARVVGEASPSYLYSERAPGEIAERCPGARALVVLRDPVERALSHHQMEVAVGHEQRPFVDALGRPHVDHPYIDGSRYAERVHRYRALLGPERVHVSLYEDYRHRPGEFLNDLAAFCGVARAGFGSPSVVNPALEPRSRRLNTALGRTGIKDRIRRWVPGPVRRAGKRIWYGRGEGEAIPEGLRRELRELFRSDVEELSELLERDLSVWR